MLNCCKTTIIVFGFPSFKGTTPHPDFSQLDSNSTAVCVIPLNKLLQPAKQCPFDAKGFWKWRHFLVSKNIECFAEICVYMQQRFAVSPANTTWNSLRHFVITFSCLRVNSLLLFVTRCFMFVHFHWRQLKLGVLCHLVINYCMITLSSSSTVAVSNA